MASLQPVEETCNNATQPSFVNTQTQCTTKTQAYYSQTQTTNLNHEDQTKAHGHSSGYHGSKKRSEHKRGLFQKLKDGLTGGDSSSSDSESDDEHRGRRRSSHC